MGSSPTEACRCASPLRSPASVRAICTQIVPTAVPAREPRREPSSVHAWWRSGAESVEIFFEGVTLRPFGSSSVQCAVDGSTRSGRA